MLNEYNFKSAIIVAVNLKSERTQGNEIEFLNDIEELKALAYSCYINVKEVFIQNLEKVNSKLYIGTGKLEEINEYIKENDIDVVVFNTQLSPSQITNIQKYLNVEILDRTKVILDIFSLRAKTKEAKLQVEVAKLKYELPRLVGMHTNLSRQGGGSSFSNKGSGETKLELDRRTLEKRLTKLNEELEELEKKRNVQSKQREKSNVPRVSLVGYTNAGKSTILNSFVDRFVKDETKRVFEENMLFATLDTYTRKITLEDNKTFLLSDTVGFVNHLPHDLVKAFRSTLNEVKNSDLLINVVDISDKDYDKKIKVTKDTLKQIGAEDIKTIYVYNKADLKEWINTHDILTQDIDGDSLYMVANKNVGMDVLIQMISNKIFSNFVNCKMCIPYSKGGILSFLKQNANITKTEYLEDGTYITVSLKEEDYNRFTEYVIEE